MKCDITPKKASMSKKVIRILFLIALNFLKINALQATVIINPTGNGGFESGNTFLLNNWTVVNDANNKWYVGSFAKCNGTNAVYIDVNATAGLANTYQTGTSHVSHFYRDVAFPAGENSITLSFNYKGQGEAFFDYMNVYLVGTSITPVAGTQLAAGRIGNTYYNLVSTCTSETINIPASFAGTTQRLVFSWINDNSFGTNPAMMIDDISLVSAVALPPPNDDPCLATALPVNGSCVFSTYTNSLATNTAGVSTPSCGGYLGGDVWFTVVVPPSGAINFDSKGIAMNDGAMAIYTGSCGALTEIACDDNSSGNLLMPALSLTGQTPGNTLWVRFWALNNTNNGSFQICASTFTPLPNDNPCNATVVPVNTTCNYATYTNAGATATLGVTAPTCSNYAGGDVWFTATIPASGLLIIDSNTGVVLDGGMSVYTGTCGALTQVACDDDGSANGLMPMLTISNLAPGTQIWIRFWEYGNDNNGTFSLCLYNPCNAGPPVNDNCINAVTLILGVPATGTNVCATNTGEPTAPPCWITVNPINSVWYAVQAPASGQIRVRVIPNTLTNPQVAMYSGTCGVGMTLLGCNDNATGCGTATNYSSDLTVSGLVNGTTYYIVVDGYTTSAGVFGILAIDGSLPLPNLSNGQDCGTYLAVCDTSMSFGNPGFQSFGNICDFPGGGSNCLLSGERGSVWFEIPINASGSLAFNIIPKDWPGSPSTGGTDYDFAVWKTSGAGAVTCAQIATGSAPIKCNYDFLGVTGLYGAVNGVAPPQYPGFGTAYLSTIPVVAGEIYVLVVSNFSNSSAGFDVQFSNTSPVAYASTGTSSTWSGGLDNSWFKSENWGGCPIPTCTRDAIINGGISIQPTIMAAGANARSIIINPGAVLTLIAGQTLNICQDFTNYGSLVASPTSTLLFANANVNQNLNGSLVFPNSMGNVTVNKTGGTVKLLQNAEMSGDFLVANNTSTFDANSKLHRVGGDFTNSGFYTSGTGTLEFNGTAAQSYFNTTSVNNVTMKHTSTGVTINTNLILANTGVLTLTTGKIITSGITEVQIFNRTPASSTTGNATSYVEGLLRRYINATGSYDFPVGNSAKGYEIANVNFAYAGNPTVIDNVLASFQSYGAVPVALNVTNCAANFSSPALDNGKWIFATAGTSTSGNFDMTLHNSNYSNAAGIWTIMSDFGGGWALANGNCVVSPVTAVTRTSMNGLSGSFGTAQGPSTLPIELLSINATVVNNFIQLKWITASEKNNKGFKILRASENGIFENIGWVNGFGNSTVLKNYSFNDINVKNGLYYYYRLQQVDFDGTETLSPIVSAKLLANNYDVSLFPNPIFEESLLTFNNDSNEGLTIELVNTFGQTIGMINNKIFPIGINQLLFNPKHYSCKPGIYNLLIRSNRGETHLKFLYLDK